jgi:monofunctional biosynthetic peptidoglycan transglycosylase
LTARRRKKKSWAERLKPVLFAALRVMLLIVVLGPPVGALLFAVLPVPMTPLMAFRLMDGQGLVRVPVPLSQVSRNLVLAVIASEDARFCAHHGFDWNQIDKASQRNAEGGALRGASTISQQTAKNVFLWPGRDWIRKGLEAYTTFFIETLWSKTHILETYLNIAEWGPGIYGAEAAARYHFGKTAATLSEDEAAQLAVLLPDPRHWRPSGPYVRERAQTIAARLREIDAHGLARCVGK